MGVPLRRMGYSPNTTDISYLCIMNKPINSINSIYGSGLTVSGGRLVNHAPDGVMGIVAAANARREMKHERKIQMQAEAYSRGQMMSTPFHIPHVL